MALEDVLPNGALNQADIDALTESDRFERVVPVLDFNGSYLSLVVQVDEKSVGLHCDHDTGKWKKTVSGDDFGDVMQRHDEWLDEDMDRVLDGM